MEAVDDDDFGELYADVEMQATSAISAIQALTELSSDTEISVEDSGPLEVNEGVISGENANAGEEKEEDVSNGQLNATESGSDSEDDFDIGLNDDNAKGSNNREKLSCNEELRSGNWINEEEYVDDWENHIEIGGKGGLTNGAHSPLHKYGKSPSATHSSYLEIDASIGGSSYSSTLNRGDREDDSFTRRFGTKSIVNQHGHYFSLPHSRIILDVNIDAFDHKPWRHPGADLTDYFNFGLNEDSWKKYCNNLKQEIDSQHAAITSATMAVPKKDAKSKQERTASPADEKFPAEHPLEMPKGRPIEVQYGKERLPSADTMHSIERDPDVIIQIPVQNLQDNCLISNKVPFDQSTNCPHKASVNEVASGDVEDMQNFSSDGEDKSLKMERLAGGTGKSVSERCLRMTSGRETNPVSMDPDKNGCLMLPDPDEHFQLTDSDSDGMPEVEGNFQEPKKTVGRCRETTAAQSRKKLESFHGKQRRCTRSSSPSETSKGAVCAGSGEYKGHSRRALTNSDSGFRDAVKVDIRSGKDFRKSGISSRSIGENKYFGRRNNFKFHEGKHGRMSMLENHMDDESASYMSGGEFYDKHDYKRRSPMAHDKQRSRMHPHVFHKEKNDFYDELPKYSSNCKRQRLFNCPPESPYDACSRERGHRDFDFDRDQGQSPIPKGKQHFLERISVMRGEGMEWELHQCEREFFAQEMDILESTRLNELITESSQIFDDKFTQRKRKAEEHYLNGRTGTGGLLTKYSYPDDFTRDEIRSIPCYDRAADHMETKCARHLLYDRRDYAKSLVTDERKHYGGLLNGDETFCPVTYDEMGSRCTRDGLSLNTYKDHQNTSWGSGKSATSPRDGVFQRNGSLRRLNRTEHCRDSNALVNCSDDFEYDMITENAIFMEEFPKRVQYQKSEVLSWDELDYNSDIPYDCLQADKTLSPFDRRTYPVSGRCKKHVKMHGSCGREKLVNGRELDSWRYRLSKEDGNHRQFGQNPNMITREKFSANVSKVLGFK